MVLADLTGQKRIYESSDALVPIKSINSFFENRSVLCQIDLSSTPRGSRLNSELHMAVLIDRLANSGAAHIETGEGLFLNLATYQEYERDFKVVKQDVLQLLAILDDEEQYTLSKMDASWFVEVFNKTLKEPSAKVYSDGTSVFIAGDLTEYLFKNYRVKTKTIEQAKQSIQTEINFIYNRASLYFIDSGKLAVACANYFNGSLHRPTISKL